MAAANKFVKLWLQVFATRVVCGCFALRSRFRVSGVSGPSFIFINHDPQFFIIILDIMISDLVDLSVGTVSRSIFD